MHNIYHDIPELRDIGDENWPNVSARRNYRKQIVRYVFICIESYKRC